jgi:hypothetical protein
VTALRSREQATLPAPRCVRNFSPFSPQAHHIIPELAVFKAKLLSVFELQWLTILPAPDTETLPHFAHAVYLRVSYTDNLQLLLSCTAGLWNVDCSQ